MHDSERRGSDRTEPRSRTRPRWPLALRHAATGFPITVCVAALLQTAPAHGAPAGAASAGDTSATRADPRVVEEVVVTADHQQRELLSLPASVSVFGRDRIEARVAEHLEDLIPIAPNVQFASGASRARFFQIRGIGERGQFAEPLNASVGLVIDDVDFSGVGTAALLDDVEQVEILRGPQGTRYGANALAGMISVRTRAPADAFGYRVSAELADHDTRAIGAAVTGPLTESLAARVSVQQRRSDGFMRNDFLGRDDVMDRDERAVRARFAWAATSDLDVDASIAWIDVDNGYDAFSLENDRHTRSDEPGRDAQESWLASLRATWSGARGFDLLAMFGFADSEADYGYDEDWTFAAFHPFGYSSTDRYRRDRRNVSAELRLVSGPEGRLFAGSTDWVAGLYVQDTDVDLRRDYTFLPGPFESGFETRRWAAYGELSRPIGELWTLSGGLRIERRAADYADSDDVAFDPEETLAGGQVSIERTLGDDAIGYVDVSRGFKAGGFNTDGSLDADLREFDSESLWSVEAGIKGRFLDDALSLRAAVFTMRRDDVQIASSLVRVRSDGSAEFIDFTGNAAEGINRGVEIEVDWLASDALTLTAALGLLDTEYQDFINAEGNDLDGRDQAHAPNWQAALGAVLAFGHGFTANVRIEGRDGFYFSDGHDARARGHALVHAGVRYVRGPLEVHLFARNLLGEHYATRGYFFGNDPRTDYAPNDWIQLGEPRRVGVRLTWATD